MKKQLFQFVFIAMLVLLGVAGCTSFEEIKERADGGDPSMQYRAGLCYRDGKDVQANPDTAYSYFKKAADGGSFAGALCYAQEALRRKDISEPAKFLERIQKVFTEQPRNSEDRDARWEMRRDYPKFCIEFAILLKNADVGLELANFKNEALRFFSKKYLYRRHDVVGQYTAKLKAIRSKKEIAEEGRRAEEKRIAGEKRRAEERRRAEEKRIAGEKRRAEAAKAWAEEKRPRPGETRGQFKERVYNMLRAEADCPPLPGETPSEWRKRFEGRKNVQSGRRRQTLTLDEAMAESRREIKRTEEKRAADQRYYAAKHAFDSKLAEEDRLVEEKRRAEEQRRAEEKMIAEKKCIESGKSRLEEKYRKVGIKLYKHIYSGTSVRFFLSTMKSPMEFLRATRIGNDDTKYLITVRDGIDFTESKEIDFIVGFKGILKVRDMITRPKVLCTTAPPGFLFGVRCNFYGNVSAEALMEKVKKDYPDAKEFPGRKMVIKHHEGVGRDIDFDVIVVTKVWESERVRITGNYFLIEFTGKEKTLPEIQRNKLKEDIIRHTFFSYWVQGQLSARETLEAGLSLPLNGMIIIDKKMAETMNKIGQKAKERDAAEQEAIRKRKEQKSLDF